MSVLWLFPLALAGLAALLVPLLLHLDRRRSVRVVAFAAMRWLGARQRPRRTWRLREWLLLLLRLALILALVLWLAQPVLRGEWRAAQRWLAVVPGVSDAVVSNARQEGERVVWLAPGLPQYSAGASVAAGANASLLRELDAALPKRDTLRVLVPQVIDGLDATSIVLSRAVDWEVAGDSVGKSPHAPPLANPDPADRSVRRLALRYEHANDPALRYLRAAIAAWSESKNLVATLDEAAIGAPLPSPVDAVVWIGAAGDDHLHTIARDGAVVLQIPSVVGDASTPAATTFDAAWPPSATHVGQGRLLHSPMPLTPQHVAALQSADFPVQLHRVLFGEGPSPSRAKAVDVAPQVDATLLHEAVKTPLRDVLVWVIAMLFLLERIVANGRRLQGAR